LAAGITDHRIEALGSDRAARDAEDLAKAMRRQEKALYDSVAVDLFVDRCTTTDVIRTSLRRLQRTAPDRNEETTHLVYLAGRLMRAADGRLYYLGADTDPESVEQSALSLSLLGEILRELPGRTVLLLDISGSADAEELRWAGLSAGDQAELEGDKEIVQEVGARESGIIVWVSFNEKPVRKAGRTAAGRAARGHLVGAILAGLEGEADYTNDGEITLNELEIYVRKSIQAAAGSSSAPVFFKPLGARDFPIAAVPE
jgi:hypothetical protein